MKKRMSYASMLTIVIATAACRADVPTSVATPVPAATQTTVPARAADGSVTPAVKDPNRHKEFLYRITQGPIGLLFVGDSITDAWPRRGEFSWLKFAPYQPADFGISADKTEHVLWRITNGELEGVDPKVVVVLIGTNNIGNPPRDTPAQAAAGVTKVVETIRAKLPRAKVLLLAVFPRDVKGSGLRDAAEAINPIIAKLDDGANVRYLDINHVFLDADGNIPADVMPDKLHPTSKGYDLWYEAMRPLLDEMMK